MKLSEAKSREREAHHHVSDLGIRDGKIATIGRISKEAACLKKEIDATGKHVCPGFVDLHTHKTAASATRPARRSTASAP